MVNWKKILKSKTALVTYSVLTIALVSLLFVFLFGKDKTVMAAGCEITPINFDNAGVDLNSSFRITTTKKYDESYVKTILSISPQQDYSLKKLYGNVFELKFNNPLKADSIYKFILNDQKEKINYSWAFQTKKEFRVVATLPRNHATSVPINSGIEITFSYSGAEKIEKYFSIEPQVKGKFEYHKKTAVFVPEKLDYNTVYTVRLKKGIRLKDSDEKTKEECVFQFQTKLKEEETRPKHYIEFSKDLYNFIPTDTIFLNTYPDDYFLDKDIDVHAYKYNNEKDFSDQMRKNNEIPNWAIRQNEKKVVDKQKLSECMTFKTKLQDKYQNKYIVFPKGLDEGHYYITASQGEYEIHALLQVNDILSYVMIEKNKSLIWANTAKSGKPAKGIAVALEGEKTVVTDKDGIARIDFKKPISKEAYYYFTLKDRNKPSLFISMFGNQYYPYSGFSEDNSNTKYWSYLYLDRDMYLPEDTVKVWGFVKSRQAGKTIKNVTLELKKYTDMYSIGKAVLDSKEIQLSTNGTFTGEIKLKNYNYDSYYIEILVDGKVLSEKRFEIHKYVKPAYKIEITPDKKNIFLGDDINYDIQANFFEGSSVSGLKLDYNASCYELTKTAPTEGKLTCNSNGGGTLRILPGGKDEPISNSWNPVYVNLRVCNSQPEEEEISTINSVAVFPRDVMIQAESSLKDKKCMLKINTNKINLDNLKDDEYGAYNPDNYRGDKIGMNLNIKVYERYWDSAETGQYYDFIDKVVKKTYRYFKVSNQIGNYNVSTEDGNLNYSFDIDTFSERKSYYIEIIGADSKNRVVKENVYLYTSYFASEGNGEVKNYDLRDKNNKYQYKLNESISLDVLENNQKFEMKPDARILYMTLKNGLINYTVSNQNTFSTNFEEKYVPDTAVKAIYFDGTHIYDAGTKFLYYDYSEKKLNIKVSTDKKSYRPGDNVNIDVNVKDLDGNPCKADVNLSVVDEAFFAVRDQSVDTLGELYNYVFGTGIINDYLSFDPQGGRYGGAECGEGGDAVPIREKFKDNAFFKSITTDNAGKGQVSFKLPDNLTSWRITYQGVTEDLKAGCGKENISSKLPFFVNIVMNDTYLNGDKPGIILRTAGDGINSRDNIKYEVIIEGPDYKKTMKQTQLAGKSCEFILDSLKAGNYSVTVKAAGKGLGDGIKKNFRIVNNLLESARTKYYELTDGTKLTGESAHTELVFYNRDLYLFHKALNSLYYSWGDRVDQKLSEEISRKLLKKYFNQSYYGDENIDFKSYQIFDGGIALFNYDSSNAELSAKVCSISKDYFDTEALKEYFYGKINDKESTVADISASYWGLAALNEPVLIDIRDNLKNPDISLKEKLYLGCALAELGDYSGASEVYSGVLKAKGKQMSPYMYIEAGEDKDDIMEMTSLCAIIGIKTGEPEAQSLFSYVVDNSTQDLLLNLEKLIYITTITPKSVSQSSFSYELNGKKENIDLSKVNRFTLTLTSEMAKNIKFSNVTNISVAENFIGSVKDLMKPQNQLVKINRKYTVNGKEKTVFKQTDLIKVYLDFSFNKSAPEGFYQITDVLPSGFKYVPPRNMEEEDWHFEGVEGQQVTFWYHYNKKDKKDKKSISYLARVSSPGKFTADNALIKHVKSEACGFTERKTIEVR